MTGLGGPVRTYDIQVGDGPGVIVSVPADSELASYDARYERKELGGPVTFPMTVLHVHLDFTLIESADPVSHPVTRALLRALPKDQEQP